MSIVAMFTSLVIASDYALAPALNVKLMDALVFSSAYAFGFRVGAYIAVMSELIWCVASPFGNAGYISPFLIAGEMIFVVAAYFCSKLWKMSEVTALSYRNVFLGATLAICAFVWDFETNLATGLLALWPNHLTLAGVLVFQVLGVPFMIPHELGDFVLGSFLVPVVIAFCRRHLRTITDNEKLLLHLETK